MAILLPGQYYLTYTCKWPHAAGRDTLPVAAMCRVDLFLTHLVPSTLIDDCHQASNSPWYRPILTVLQSLSQLLLVLSYSSS